MPAVIDTGGPRVLHNHECSTSFLGFKSTPKKSQDKSTPDKIKETSILDKIARVNSNYKTTRDKSTLEKIGDKSIAEKIEEKFTLEKTGDKLAPQKLGDNFHLDKERIFKTLRYPRTYSEGLRDLDSSPEVGRRKIKRSRRSEAIAKKVKTKVVKKVQTNVFEEVKTKVDNEVKKKVVKVVKKRVDDENEFCNVSRIHEYEDEHFGEQLELRGSVEVAKERSSSTTCHVIANRRYSESRRTARTIGGFVLNKLKGRFRSEPRISVSSERKSLVSSHPCSKDLVCPRSNPLTLQVHRDYCREQKFASLKLGFDPAVYPIDLEIEPAHLEIDPLKLGLDQLNDRLNVGIEHLNLEIDNRSVGIDHRNVGIAHLNLDIDHLNVTIDHLNLEIDPVRLEIDNVNASHLAISRDTLSSVRKKRKINRQCSNKCSYFQLVFLLFLIAFGQSGLLSSGVLRFHRKTTGLSVLTIGMVIGAVTAAPVDLMGDMGIRAERSANLSHITGASRKIQMYVKNRYLQILPDGTVNGSNEDSSDYTIFQRTSVSRGQLRIQGVATCLYLCMDSCGLLYGSHEYTEDCIFNETIEQHNYNTYSSVRWSTNRKTLYLGLNRYGEPRRVQAKGHNLGRLSAYSRVLTIVVPPDRVETLHRRMLATHHNVRHRHNTHHHHKQQNLCPRVIQSEKDNVDTYRCRKRKKRRKRKRKCREDEDPGPQCEQHVDSVSSEGLPESKRSCEGAASDEVCRRQALDAAAKKRKSRMEKVGSAGRNQQQKDSKKGKKQPSTKKPNSDLAEHEDEKEKKPDSMNGKKKGPGFKRTSLQAKKKLPGRTASSAVPREPPSTSPSSWSAGASTTGSTVPASGDAARSKQPSSVSSSSVKVTSGSASNSNTSAVSKDTLRAMSAGLADFSSPLDSSEDDRFDASYSNEDTENSSLEYGAVTISGASVELSEDEGYSSTPRTMRLIKAGKLKDSTRRLAM